MTSLSTKEGLIGAIGPLHGLGFVHLWDFQATVVPLWRRRQVAEALLRRGIRSPKHLPIKDVAVSCTLWALYFVYSPDGVLTQAHRSSLARLRLQGFGVFVVVATKTPYSVPAELAALADAVYWKALPGYDFSAYRLGLSVLARHASGSTVLVMNDSVLGPLSDVMTQTVSAPWDLTGFTASGRIENHIQSYAFIVKNLTRARLLRLSPVLFPFFACGGRDDAITCQESRLARVASDSMSVGAYWYLGDGDPTQVAPFELMEAGYPFFKRSLSEARSPFADKKRARDFMASLPD